MIDDPTHGAMSTGSIDVTTARIEVIFTLPVCNGKGYASAIMTAIIGEVLYPSELAKTDLPCVEMMLPL